MSKEVKENDGSVEQLQEQDLPAGPALTAEELEEIADARKLRAKRKAGNKGRRKQWLPEMSITSLMDMMTILLVYMLVNYSTNPLNITVGEDLQLVRSLETSETFEHLVPVAITKNHIVVDNAPIVQVKDGKVSAKAKREGEDGYFITPLFDSLKDVADHQKKLAQYNKSVKFTAKLLIVGDQEVPFRLLTEVLYTAGQAEFNQFEFAVIKQ
ncbi:MAG: hypothetical protein C4523_21330 [Myxococcales bacterium]|nr:MAG: hypothetical protein C4523_21330 [Myxococcales bacterium]